MHLVGTVVSALGAAVCFAVSAVLQQRAARGLPGEESLRVRLLFDLARHPSWLGGVASMLVAYGLEALALGLGDVTLVAPLVVTELLFALALGAHLNAGRVGPREWAGAACVVGGIVTFLVVARPTGKGVSPPFSDWIPGLVPCAAVVVLMVLVARTPQTPRRAGLLGVAAGISFGLVAVLTKTAVTILEHRGVAALLSRWEPYVLVAVGLGGFLVGQSAYQAAPLKSSLPVIDTVEPVIAVVLAATVLKEHIGLTAVALALESGAGLLAIAGVFLLGRSPIVLSTYARARSAQRPIAPPTTLRSG